MAREKTLFRLSTNFTISILVLAGLVSLTLLFYLTSSQSLGIYDESIIKVGALRIIEGEWPSRGFYANYGPLQFLIIATLYEVFGISVAIGRLYDALLHAGIAVSVAGCLWVSGVPRAIPGALAVGVLYQFLAQSPLYVLTPATLLLLMGGAILIRNLSRGVGIVSYLPLASLYALSIAFRYDFALIAGFAFGLAALLVFLDDVVIGGRPALAAVCQIFWIALTLFTAASASLAFLLWVGVLGPAFQHLIIYNTENYSQMRALPFPRIFPINSLRQTLEAALFYLPFVSIAITAAIVPFLWCKLERRYRVTLLVLLSTTVAGILPALVRSDLFHMFCGGLSAVTLLFAIFGIIEKKICYQREGSFATFAVLSGTAGLIILAAFAAFLKMPPLGQIAQRLDADILFTRGLSPTVETRLGPFSITPEELELARFITSKIASEERILSVTGRHDKIFINNLRIYFVTGRLPGTFFHHFDPGVQTTKSVQLEIIRDIELNDIRIIFRDERWDNVMESNLSAVSSKVDDLDTYIARNFHVGVQVGQMTVLFRN